LALGVQGDLVVAGRRLARQGQRSLDVLRLASLDRDAGQLLAAIGLGEIDLEVLRRVGAEIDCCVAAAVVGDADLVFERGGGGTDRVSVCGGSLKLRTDRSTVVVSPAFTVSAG